MESIAQSEAAELLGRGIRPVVVESQGRVVRVKLCKPPVSWLRGKRRGRVSGFSRASGRRLMERLNRLSLKRLVSIERVRFLTLTFPPEVAPGLEVCYAVLRRFLERVRRHYPKVSAPWVMELQASGNPHYHLLWCGSVLSKKTLAWLRASWEECIGWDTATRGYHVQVNVERVRSEKEVCSYMASYVSKGVGSSKLDSGAYPHGEASGFRWWGVHNRGALPLGELVRAVGAFSPAVYAWRRAVLRCLQARIRAGEVGLVRLAERFKAGPVERVQGWLLYTDDVGAWLRCFASIPGG